MGVRVVLYEYKYEYGRDCRGEDSADFEWCVLGLRLVLDFGVLIFGFLFEMGNGWRWEVVYIDVYRCTYFV